MINKSYSTVPQEVWELVLSHVPAELRDNIPKPWDWNFTVFKRIVSEIYRDHLRKDLKNMTKKNFLKKYKQLKWSDQDYEDKHAALAETPDAHMDHFIPLNFFVTYMNGRYLDVSVHPRNIEISLPGHNQKKGKKRPCSVAYNEKMCIIAKEMHITSQQLKTLLDLYEHNHPDFYKEFDQNTAMTNLNKSTLKADPNYQFADYL